MDPATELPWYRCFKVVQAAKIVAVDPHAPPAGTAVLLTVELGEGVTGQVEVDRGYLVKHQPKVGGYLVRYEDGYLSWSPAKAFEDGYRRIDDPRG
jgi:hypothetical protein